MGLGFLLNSRTQTALEPSSLHFPRTMPEIAATSLIGPSFSAAPGSEKQGASGRRALWRGGSGSAPTLVPWENVGNTLPLSEPPSLHLCTRVGMYQHLWFFLTLLSATCSQTSCTSASCSFYNPGIMQSSHCNVQIGKLSPLKEEALVHMFWNLWLPCQ